MKAISLPMILMFTLLLAGCGYNVKAIKTFEESTVGFSGSFKDIVKETEARCALSRKVEALTIRDKSKYKDIEEWVSTHCTPLAEKNKTMLMVADVVVAYANGLALVVGVDPSMLDDELSKMETVAGELENREGNNVIKKSEVTATAAVGKFLASVYLTHQVKKHTVRNIQQHKDMINTDVEKLALYVSDIYKKEVERDKILVGGAMLQLERSSVVGEKSPVGPSIPYRMAQIQFAEGLKDADKAEEIAISFQSAANDMVKANNDLEQNFSKLSKDEQLASVLAFAKQAKAVRDAVDDIK